VVSNQKSVGQHIYGARDFVRASGNVYISRFGGEAIASSRASCRKISTISGIWHNIRGIQLIALLIAPEACIIVTRVISSEVAYNISEDSERAVDLDQFIKY